MTPQNEQIRAQLKASAIFWGISEQDLINGYRHAMPSRTKGNQFRKSTKGTRRK